MLRSKTLLRAIAVANSFAVGSSIQSPKESLDRAVRVYVCEDQNLAHTVEASRLTDFVYFGD